MTRDSLILKIVPLLSMLAAVVVATITDPAEWGLSPIALKWIGLMATLLGTVSGWLSTSWLKGENDETKVTKRARGPRPGGLMALLLAAGLATSCAGFTPQPVTPHPTGPTAEQIQSTRAKAVQIAKAVESIGGLVVEARRTASTAHAAGLITREQRDAVNQAVIDLEPKAHAVIDLAASVTTDLQLGGVVRALTTVVDDLLAKLSVGTGPMAASAKAIRAALEVAYAFTDGKAWLVTGSSDLLAQTITLKDEHETLVAGKCSRCVREGVKSTVQDTGACVTTLVGVISYYDESGKLIAGRDPNKTTCQYTCSRGHSLVTVTGGVQ